MSKSTLVETTKLVGRIFYLGNSRGGTFFINRQDSAEAKKKLIEVFGMEPEELESWDENWEETLGILHVPTDQLNLINEQDLEWGLEGTVFSTDRYCYTDFDETLPDFSKHQLVMEFVPKGRSPQILIGRTNGKRVHPRWDDDAVSFVFYS